MKTPKYTRLERNRWYAQVEIKKLAVKEVCEIFGISRQCYYEWHKKDRLWRRTYRTDLPSKVQPNTKLTPEIKAYIRDTKLKYNYGPVRMKMAVKKEFGLNVSTTIIYRFFKIKGLIRRPQKKLPWYQPMKQKLVVKQAGEGVQMDVKYIYPKSRRQYQFSVFDPYTNLYHFSIFDTKESKNCIEAFLKAEQYFGFKILSVQTDNGSEARGEFHRWLTAKNIPHYFIPKKSPWWNAQVERIHRTVDDEYYHNPFRIWKTVYEWMDFYNTQRIHTKLNGLTPIEKLAQSVTIDC
jgi:transposase-like protein